MDIGEPALELLLDLLDQPEPVIAGPVLIDVYPAAERQLVGKGLLVPDGHEAADSSRDHDDAPVALTWSDEEQSFGFFNSQSGWVSVDTERITRYRVDRRAVAEALLGRAGRPAANHGTPDEIWDLREMRVANRTHMIQVVLLRRAHDPQVWQATREWLAQSPPARLRAVLCATTPDRLPVDPPRGNVLISLRDVLVGHGALQIDRRALSARLEASPQQRTDAPVLVSGDGRQVTLRGKSFRFAKGDQQRRIIWALYEYCLRGEYQVATAAIIEELDLPGGARIRDYFKRHKPPVMGHLLWEEDGMCGFCLDH
jgi:hypothetical protein